MNPIIHAKMENIRAALAEKRPLNSAWLFMGCPIAAEIVAHGGFDFVILDTEHAPGTNETMYHQIRACDAAGMPVIVRLPRVDAALATQAIDAGAIGVAVPDIRDAEAVRDLVKYTRYAPAGTRGTHRVARASGYGFDWKAYSTEIAPNLLVMALIESPEGVEAAPEICAVEGLDALFIGGVDLAAALGRLDTPGHPEVVEAKALVAKAASDAGVPLGGLAANVAAARKMYADGYALVSLGSDLVWLRDQVMATAQALQIPEAAE